MQARIDALALQIVAFEAAILAFAANGAQLEYRFEDGAQSIRVERAEPDVMRDLVDAMINQHEIYCVRTGQSSGAHNSRGAW